MERFVSKGTVAAALSVTAILAGAFGYDALGRFLNDPTTVTTVLTVVGALGTIYAGVAEGLKKKTPVE